MNIEDQQELISAYLDGELTSDEQRAAEALLAESEEARQWLEELRGLQSQVRELPKFSLGADFGQAVLDQAERAMISGDGIAAAAGTDVDDRDGESDETGDEHDLHVFYAERDKADHVAVVKRRIVWSVLAVAAALLIMVVLPQQEPQDIARLDKQAGSSDAKTAPGSAKTDKTSASEAGKDEGGRIPAVSASEEAADMQPDQSSVAATERESEQEGSARRGLLPAQPKAAEPFAQDGASADNARQPVAGAIVGEATSPKDRAAAVASGGAGPALEVAPEANVKLQMAADYDGIAVFEMDEQSVANIDGLKSVGDAPAPADNAWQFFRPVPLDKLAELRDAPFADEAEADVAKRKSDSAEQVYAYVAEGTSEEIELALRELGKRATNYQAVEMKPQLAASLAEFAGGRSLARVESSVADDAKKQPAQSGAFGRVADAEAPAADAPVANAIEAAPSKPAPALAPAEKPAAPKKSDNDDVQDKLRKDNGTLARDTNRDSSEPSASAPPAANPAPVAPSLAAAAEGKTHDELKSQAEAEELAKRVVRSIASGELRARRQAQRELQEPLSEAASAAQSELSREKVKGTTEEAGKQAEKTVEKREAPKVPSQPAPAPTAETAEEAPSVQGSKQPDAVAGQTYRVLVVFNVKSTK